MGEPICGDAIGEPMLPPCGAANEATGAASKRDASALVKIVERVM
jgi:hypothetical protein